jgi:hypothetical protein
MILFNHVVKICVSPDFDGGSGVGCGVECATRSDSCLIRQNTQPFQLCDHFNESLTGC